jgi:hypothetical protein
LNTQWGRTLLVALGIALVVASTVHAQTSDGGPDPNEVRVRFGPLWMNPTLTIPNIGIDTNVFNESPGANPKSDFVVQVLPKADMWVRMGRTWLLGTVAEDLVWYQTYSTERSANQGYSVGWKAPLNRFVLETTAGWVRTRSRPGFEIDARALRTEPRYAASAEVRGFSKTFIGVRGTWARTAFDELEEFKGVNLSEQLDRTSQSAAVTIRQAITPLTSVTFSAGRSDERFEFEPSRDWTSDDYSVAVTFDPAALVKGTARLGHTAYHTEASDLEDYNGLTSAVDLSYTLAGSTRFSTTIGRRVESSYDINQPFYVLTGATGSVSQRIYGPVDAVVRLGGQRMEYRSRSGVAVEAADRTDHVRTFGGGIGFRVGRDLRLGFNVDKERRESVVSGHEYDGLKYGAAITYGP